MKRKNVLFTSLFDLNNKFNYIINSTLNYFYLCRHKNQHQNAHRGDHIVSPSSAIERLHKLFCFRRKGRNSGRKQCACRQGGVRFDEPLQRRCRQPQRAATGGQHLPSDHKRPYFGPSQPCRQPQCEHPTRFAANTPSHGVEINTPFCHPVSRVPEGIPHFPAETHLSLAVSVFSRFSL